MDHPDLVQARSLLVVAEVSVLLGDVNQLRLLPLGLRRWECIHDLLDLELLLFSVDVRIERKSVKVIIQLLVVERLAFFFADRVPDRPLSAASVELADERRDDVDPALDLLLIAIGQRQHHEVLAVHLRFFCYLH